MNKMRIFWRGLIALLVVVAVTAAGALGYRDWRQHDNAQALAITTPNGIDVGIFVKIGGIDQWVQIRGDDRRNPVLLFLHGGPGISMIPLTPVFQPWEKYFTVVQWDQRGAGKTYGRNGEAGSAPMTIDRMTQDGLQLTQFLERHLHQSKIVVVGHSWGTVLGLRMVKQRPDLFSAYVGTGQLVDKAQNEKTSYAMVMDKARAAHDATAVAELQRIGVPPYADFEKLLVQRKWQAAYNTPAERDLSSKLTPTVLFAPDYSLRDIWNFLAAAKFSQRATYAELNDYDALKLGTTFDVPFFVFEGDRDALTPAVLAQDYVAKIQAPVKAFVLLKGGGHTAVLTMPDVFLRELVTRVRPLAVQSETGVAHG
jgi:pimeloyl-ACP methyl ester carboxylesterase